MFKGKNTKGFTLVELLIVIAVLGMLAAIGVSSMNGITNTFKKKADIENANIIARKIEIEVLAGEITATTTDISNPDFPQSATSGRDLIADVTFNEDGTCTVTVKDNDSFTHDVSIASQGIN